MAKLLFLFDDCEKIVLRIGEDGFIKECEKRGVPPCRVIALNGLTEEPKPYSIIEIERAKQLYIVKPGDDLQSIESAFCVSGDDVLAHNQIPYIYPYQTIEIPKKKED